MTGLEALDLAWLRGLAREDLHVVRDARHAHGDVLVGLQGNIPDLREINRMRAHVGGERIELEAHEHIRQRIDSRGIRDPDRTGDAGGLLSPTADCKLEARIEESGVEPAIEDVENGLGDAFRISLALPDYAFRILGAPSLQKRRQQCVTVLEEPVETGP